MDFQKTTILAMRNLLFLESPCLLFYLLFYLSDIPQYLIFRTKIEIIPILVQHHIQELPQF